jgi:hypothetical protein
MRMPNTRLAAVLAGLSIAAYGSQVSAQDTSQRDAAIARCVRAAQTQYPDDNPETNRNRTQAYKACMVAAGERP